ncbi:MAG: hypothetical protein ACI8S6_001314 [Myxococcota bacterium]
MCLREETIMRSMLLGALVLSTGCKGLSEAGIWALYLPADSTTECTEDIVHNFTDAYVPEDEVLDEGDWTITEEENTSDALAFAQIEELGDGEALLLIGSEAYPGVETTNGWKFTWEGSEDSSTTEDHSSGYGFSATTVGTSTIIITLNVDGTTAKGKLASSSSTMRSWTESDTWEVKDLGFDRGQLPAGQFLVKDGPKDTIAANNRNAEEDCSGDCSLEVSTACSGEGAFTAVQLDYEDESVYEYLDSSGQGPGL